MDHFKAIICFLVFHPPLMVGVVGGMETQLNPLLVCLD